MSLGGGSSKSGLSRDTTLVNLELAWRERLAEATALDPTHPATALGLRLYAVEIGIKVSICRTLGLSQLPTHCKTHDLNEIIIYTGLSSLLDDPSGQALKRNWDDIVTFSKSRLNDLRYLPNAEVQVAERDRMLKALDDPRYGVWTWLSSRL